MLRWSVTHLATSLALPLALALLLTGCGVKTAPSGVVSADQDSFRSIVVDSKRPVLVEFWSYSCVPCQALEPHLAFLAQEHPELLVVKINAEENQPLAEELGVRLVPTLFVYKDGEEQRRKTGVDKPEELTEFVSAYFTSK